MSDACAGRGSYRPSIFTAHFSCHARVLAQRRMRMSLLAAVDGVCTYLNGLGNLANPYRPDVLGLIQFCARP